MKVIRDQGEDSSRQHNLKVAPSGFFVSTPYVERITQRAMTYLNAGYPIHMSGPAGSGKTTIAFHIAAQLGRPVTLVTGDHQMTSSALVGSASGMRSMRLVDNYVRSVVRTEEQQTTIWSDSRLTSACRYGHTLIYDEFNRAPPEANTPLLSVLSERILALPKVNKDTQSIVDVHPEFRAIFTSNSKEYVGVYQTADALLDRMITLKFDAIDTQTKREIITARSGVSDDVADLIVSLLDRKQEIENTTDVSMRDGIALGKVLASSGTKAHKEDDIFAWAVKDILHHDLESLWPAKSSISKDHTAKETR